MSKKAEQFRDFFDNRPKSKMKAIEYTHAQIKKIGVDEFTQRASAFVADIYENDDGKFGYYLWNTIDMMHECRALAKLDEQRLNCDLAMLDWIAPLSKTVKQVPDPDVLDNEDLWGELVIVQNRHLEETAYNILQKELVNGAKHRHAMKIWENAIDILYAFDTQNAQKIVNEERNGDFRFIKAKRAEFGNLDEDRVYREVHQMRGGSLSFH